MTKNINSFMDWLNSKLTLVVLLAIGSITSASADNELKIDNFSIEQGVQKEIAIVLNNTDVMTSLQFDIKLPNKLKYVENSLRANEERLERGEQSIMATKQDNDGKWYRIGIFSNNRQQIIGSEGTLVYIKVEVDPAYRDDFNAPVEMNITDAVGANADGKGFEINKNNPYTVTVSPIVAHLTTAEDSFSIKQEGMHKVDVVLNNDVAINGLQASITLPAGLTMEKKSNGSYKFEYGDRMPHNASIRTFDKDGKINLAISSLTNDVFEGETGTLFSFNVISTKDLPESSTILIDGVVVSDEEFHAFEMDDKPVIKVTNAFIADYTPANNIVVGLQKKYDEAIAKIAADCKDVKDSVAITTVAAAIKAQIDKMKAAVDSTYNIETLAKDSETILAPAADIEASIAKLLTDAAAAQQAYVDAVARKAANEAANTKLTAQIKDLQTKLDAAKATVAKDCKDVAATFAKAEAAIQTKITAMTDSVKAEFDKVALTAESTIDVAGVEASITKLVEDAKAAQVAFEKTAANVAANTKLTAQLAKVQASLDEAVAAIAKDCKDVAATFAEAEAAIQTKITALTDSVKAKFEAEELTAESTVNTTAIEAEIAALVPAATEAQTAYEKMSANEAANTRLTAEIKAVQMKLDAAKETIATECKDVAADFDATIAAIQKLIDALTADVKTKYEAEALTAESTINTAGIEMNITKLLIDAAAAQQVAAGIEDITVEIANDKNVRIYTTSGKRVQSPVSGQVNIFKFSNGTTKKYYVK